MNTNPFDLNGPAFLALYVVVLLGAASAAAFVRWRIYGPAEEPRCAMPDLDPYEIAFLAGGSDRVMNTAFARLCHRQVLAPDAEQHHLTVQTCPEPDAHPVEQAVFRSVRDDPEKTIRELRAAPPAAVEDLRERLETHGLLLSPERAREARQWPAAILMPVTFLGVDKILVGLERQRPVEFLVFLCIVSAIVAAGFLATGPVRTRRGQRFLAWQRTRNAALHASVGRSSAGLLSGRDLALAVGLFGLGVLYAGPLAPMAKALVPPNSSGCGGGCGGGGCGGGGCGGCGGCGG